MEENKQRLMVGAIAFNFSIIIYMVAFNLEFNILKLLLGGVIALAIGAVAFFLTPKQ